MSFADICLLLLGFLVILQAQALDRRRLAAGLRDAFHGSGPRPNAPSHSRAEAAATLFAPGEAVLRPDARVRLVALGRTAAARHHGIRLESRGTDAAGSRLDRWELAAARTAAVARAIAAGGLPADAIAVAIPDLGGAGGQRLVIDETPSPR